MLTFIDFDTYLRVLKRVARGDFHSPATTAERDHYREACHNGHLDCFGSRVTASGNQIGEHLVLLHDLRCYGYSGPAH